MDACADESLYHFTATVSHRKFEQDCTPGEVLNKFLYVKVLPQGPTPYPFWQRRFWKFSSYFFLSLKIPLLDFLVWGPLQSKMTDFPTLSNTSSSEIPTLSYTWKKVPLQAEPPRIRYYREFLPPGQGVCCPGS